jgi:anti-sigma regulatory factor (Ser/Thr protein kinase)
MTLRRSPAVVPRLSSAISNGSSAASERSLQDAAWLARQHARFARSQGGEWDWEEALAAEAGQEARDAAVGNATTLAAWCLQAAWDGRQPARSPVTAAEDRLLVPSTLITEMADVRACVDRLLRAEECVPQALVFDAATILAEMAQNICEHSGSIGAVAATWTGGEDPCLSIAAVDQGVGLTEPLSCRAGAGQLEMGSRAFADRGLVRRLRLLFTPSEGPEERGMGLRLSHALVARHGGALHLRSGGLMVTLGAEPYQLCSRCPRRLAAVPGVLVCARLPALKGRGHVDRPARIAVS